MFNPSLIHLINHEGRKHSVVCVCGHLALSIKSFVLISDTCVLVSSGRTLQDCKFPHLQFTLQKSAKASGRVCGGRYHNYRTVEPNVHESIVFSRIMLIFI
jgi:hypothetical protein